MTKPICARCEEPIERLIPTVTEGDAIYHQECWWELDEEEERGGGIEK